MRWLLEGSSILPSVFYYIDLWHGTHGLCIDATLVAAGGLACETAFGHGIGVHTGFFLHKKFTVFALRYSWFKSLQ